MAWDVGSTIEFVADGFGWVSVAHIVLIAAITVVLKVVHAFANRWGAVETVLQRLSWMSAIPCIRTPYEVLEVFFYFEEVHQHQVF